MTKARNIEKNLLILGGGGHGRVIEDTALESGYQSIAWLDDDPTCLRTDQQYLGKLDALQTALNDADWQVAIGFGDAGLRLAWYERVADLGLVPATLIHPRAWVSRGAVVEAGSIILAGAMVQTGVRLGRVVIVNTGATIDHDCIVGDGVHVCPGTHLAGNVSIGRESWVGIGTSVIQGVRIGERVTIGAGSAVVDNIPDRVVAYGVPAIVASRESIPVTGPGSRNLD